MKIQPYIGDLHVHSRRSDGEWRPERIFEYASEHFLDCVALADHDARPYEGVYHGVLSLPAAEFSLGNRWHMVALGPSIPKPWPSAREISEWARVLHNLGGALILAHPWTISQRPHALQMIEQWLGEGILDGIELLNTSVRPDQFDAWTSMFRLYRMLWEIYRPAVIGGSDYHHFRHGGRMGLGCTYIFAEEPTVEAFIRAIRQRRTVAAVIQGDQFWGEWIPRLNLFEPRGEWGIGAPEWLRALAVYRRTAGNCRTPMAYQAFLAGNYRQALEVNAWEGEQG